MFFSKLRHLQGIKSVSRRRLHLHEYQSHVLLAAHQLPVPRLGIVTDVSEVARITQELCADFSRRNLIIKAQVLSEGGDNGYFTQTVPHSLHSANSVVEAEMLVRQMLGQRLLTDAAINQSCVVSKISISTTSEVHRKARFAILLDRAHDGPVMVGYPFSSKEPETIHLEPIDIMLGVTKVQAELMASYLDFQGHAGLLVTTLIQKLYNFFLKVDATRVEINTLEELADGNLMCRDVNIVVDDYAAYRQKEIFAMEDLSATNPLEVEAENYKIKLIVLEGDIGCLVNGAGLAMSTLDIIRLEGGRPANFMDFGGSVTEDMVYKAIHLLSKHSEVKVILVNLFGGIVDCGIFARGIIAASRALNIKLPMAIRLEGANADGARRLFQESGLNVIFADGLHDVAKKALKLLSG